MSGDTFYVDVVGASRIENFDQLPIIVQAILTQKVQDLTEQLAELAGDLMDERLGQKSGRLSGAGITTDVRTVGKTIEGSVMFPDLPYVRIQEKGGVIPPHMIYPRNGRALAFYGATGEKVLAKRVSHPGAVIEGKHFARDARRQMAPQISRGLKQALVQGIRQNMRNAGRD